eukprot:Colp12_sorted_trinity150504_noHs@13279
MLPSRAGRSLPSASYSYTPAGLVRVMLEWVCATGHMPWWLGIVGVTVAFRLATIKYTIKGMRNNAKMANIRPLMEKETELLNKYQRENDKYGQRMQAEKLKELFDKHDVHPLRAFVAPLIQAPVFMSFFFGLRGMAEAPVESMKTGGLMWFSDLTAVDPYYALPTIMCLSFLLSIELGADGAGNQGQTKNAKLFLRVFSLVLIPLTAKLPTAVLLQMMTNNLFTLSQLGLLKVPALRRVLDIPDRIDHPVTAKAGPENAGGFVESMKAMFNANLEEKKQDVAQAQSTKPAEAKTRVTLSNKSRRR